jgi:membrane associated rhomboid family serine protease
MFPYRIESPRLRPAIVTAAIVTLNVLVWVLVEGSGADATLSQTLCSLGLIPAAVLGHLLPGTTIPLGEGVSCTLGTVPAWLTPLTSMFMHGGWFHLTGNMWFLWLFGRNIEDVMGPFRYAVFYLVAGFAAAAALGADQGDGSAPRIASPILRSSTPCAERPCARCLSKSCCPSAGICCSCRGTPRSDRLPLQGHPDRRRSVRSGQLLKIP